MESSTSIDMEIDQLWDYNDPAASETRFRQRLTEIADVDQVHAAIRTQIARALGLQRRFGEAHAILDAIVDSVGEASPGVEIRIRLERGRLFNSAGDQAAAWPYFEEAWELACQNAEDSLAVDAAHMLAIVAPHGEQLAWNLKALELADRSSSPHAWRWRASLYHNTGWTYHDQGDFTAALSCFESAAMLRRANGQPREERIARWCVGRALRSLGRLVEALTIQKALVAEHDALGEPDGYVFEELAECLALQGDHDGARSYFAAAYAELAKDVWLSEHEPARLARLAALGAVTT